VTRPWSGVAAQRLEFQMADVGHSAGLFKIASMARSSEAYEFLFFIGKDGIARHEGWLDVANVTPRVTITISA
jgi:hypothetical protein